MFKIKAMNLLKCTAVTLMVIAASVAEAQPSYLTGSNLRDAINGQTLIGHDWAEFYKPDGTIIGKVRRFGIWDYTGNWTASDDRICYSYPDRNTCSRLTLNGNTITHYELSGEQKKDGVAQRLSGNALNQFK